MNLRSFQMNDWSVSISTVLLVDIMLIVSVPSHRDGAGGNSHPSVPPPTAANPFRFVLLVALPFALLTLLSVCLCLCLCLYVIPINDSQLRLSESDLVRGGEVDILIEDNEEKKFVWCTGRWSLGPCWSCNGMTILPITITGVIVKLNKEAGQIMVHVNGHKQQ
jgi:hypothetical protein